MVSCVTALGSLRSPPISRMIVDVKSRKTSQIQQRCMTKSSQVINTTTSTSLDDLIHLSGPLTEHAVLRCLQARFCAKQYHVSNFFFL